jgi:hypothetical protein
MSAGEIARRHFAAALTEAKQTGYDADAVARQMLAQVISAYLETRSIADVRAEVLAAAENIDPDTDYMFMRP